MKRLIAVLACCLLPPAFADELTEVYRLPLWVDGVAEVCPWKSPSAQGYIRLIRSEKGDGRNSLYVQWVRSGLVDRPAEAVSTLAVELLESEYMVRLTMPEPQLSRTACLLSAMGEDMINERRYRFDLVLKGPGKMDVSVTRLYDSEVQADEDLKLQMEQGWTPVSAR